MPTLKIIASSSALERLSAPYFISFSRGLSSDGSSFMAGVYPVSYTHLDVYKRQVERCLPYFSGSWQHMRFVSYAPFYYIMLAMLIIALYVNQRIVNSKLGYYLKAIGEDETATEVLGVDNRASKLKALVFYSFLIGMTGGIYANMYGYIHPSFFNGPESTKVAILGIVGGRGITYGPLLAALLLVGAQEFLRASLGGEFSGLYLLIYEMCIRDRLYGCHYFCPGF